MRISGLASGMDIDSMVKEMLVREKEKVDNAKQEQQITKWKQEIYRDVIKDTKSLYDKYFSITSPNSLLSSKNYSNVSINSSNSNVITAVAMPGAEKVNYNFEITQVAQPPKLSLKIDSKKTLADQFGSDIKDKTIEITSGKDSNGNDITKTITIEDGETVSSLVKKINSEFADGSIKASYSEMTGEFTISGKETGMDSSFTVGGDLLKHIADNSPNSSSVPQNGTFNGQNLQGVVKDPSGKELKVLNEQNNSFTIDNIVYNANSTGSASLTGVTDTSKAVENMKSFVEDYNKLMDKMYDLVTQKKKNDYKPLTEEQKKEMTKEEIERWEEEAKKGILRNDREFRAFMDDVQEAIFTPLEGFGISLKDMGISSHQDYNKKAQINFDEEKFSKALAENGEAMYKALTQSTSDNKNEGIFEKLKDTIYKYAGSSSSIFAKKSGINGSASSNNNIYSNEIKKQEDNIKSLTRKMEDREKQLYAKFSVLEANLNKYNSQMSYFMQSMGY